MYELGHEVVGYDLLPQAVPWAKVVDQPVVDVDLTFICTHDSEVDRTVARLKELRVEGLWVIKSTTVPRTTQALMEKYGVHLCHNPEFLREEYALEDVVNPHMIVVGECCKSHGGVLEELYKPLGKLIIRTTPTVSEVVKLSLNAYLTTLITFWNEINELCSALALNTKEIAEITKLDPRVSHYGNRFFGRPFEGKCLPKDLDSLIQVYRELGVNSSFLESVKEFNEWVKSFRRKGSG